MGWGYVVASKRPVSYQSASQSLRLFTSRAVKAQHRCRGFFSEGMIDQWWISVEGSAVFSIFQERWVMEGDISFFVLEKCIVHYIMIL